MATIRKLHSIRKFATSQILACCSPPQNTSLPSQSPPYRPSPIIPHVEEGGYVIWKKISLFVMFPLVALLVVKCTFFPEQHCRPKFIPYEHLRIRNKRFAWGDGNHSFFHNKHLNALPDGYEVEDEECDDN